MIVGGGFVNAGKLGKTLKERTRRQVGTKKYSNPVKWKVAAKLINRRDRRNNRVNPRPYVAPKRRPVVR